MRTLKIPGADLTTGHENEPDQPSKPQKSPVSFALLWFALPVILLVVMGLLGNRS